MPSTVRARRRVRASDHAVYRADHHDGRHGHDAGAVRGVLYVQHRGPDDDDAEPV